MQNYKEKILKQLEYQKDYINQILEAIDSRISVKRLNIRSLKR